MLQDEELIVVDGCEDTCDAYTKNFEWAVDTHSPTEIIIYLSYDDPQAITPQEPDSLNIEILDPSIFYSEELGEQLQKQSIKRRQCDLRTINKDVGTSCYLMPPQLDGVTARGIESATNALADSITTVMSSNAILSLLIGASAQELMGMIR